MLETDWSHWQALKLSEILILYREKLVFLSCNLVESNFFDKSTSISVYISTQKEVQTSDIIKVKKY